MVNRYRKGADYERKIVNHYRDLGFYAARIAGSKTGVDVVVIRGNTIFLMQMKNNKLSSNARQDAYRKMPFIKPQTMHVVPIVIEKGDELP